MKKVKGKWLVVTDDEMQILVKKGESVKQGQLLAESRKTRKIEMDLGELYEKIGDEKLNLYQGEAVIKGAVWAEWGGIFGKDRLHWPVEGRYLGTEKNGKAYFEVKQEERKTVTAPVEGKIEMEEGRWWLEFTAEEVMAEEITPGKLWAEGLTEVTDWQRLNSQIKNKLGLVEEPEDLWFSKAQALGLAGVITTSSGKINTYLPAVLVTAEVWKRLKEIGGSQCKVWLNTAKGRLLIVKSK